MVVEREARGEGGLKGRRRDDGELEEAINGGSKWFVAAAAAMAIDMGLQ